MIPSGMKETKEGRLDDLATRLEKIGAAILDGAAEEIRTLKAEIERLRAENKRLHNMFYNDN